MARALNHHGIPTRSRKGDTTWTSYEVAERVKQYEARCFTKRRREIEDNRRSLTEKWSKTLYYPIRWVKPPYMPANASGSGQSNESKKGGADY